MLYGLVLIFDPLKGGPKEEHSGPAIVFEGSRSVDRRGSRMAEKERDHLCPQRRRRHRLVSTKAFNIDFWSITDVVAFLVPQQIAHAFLLCSSPTSPSTPSGPTSPHNT